MTTGFNHLPVQRAGSFVRVVSYADLPPDATEGDARWVDNDNALYLFADGVWVTQLGGTVSGPGSTTNNALARWSGTGGTSIKNSPVIVDDPGNISGVASITLSGTVDGRDVSTDGAALDAHIAASTGVHGVSGSVVGTSGAQTLTGKSIDADTNTITNIDNNEIKAAAGIVYSKLTLTNSIVNADIAAAAAIVYTKLNLANSIVNADIATGAAIAATKIGAGTVDNTEFGYLDGVTSAIQTQFSNKQPLDGDLTAVAGLTTTGLVTRTATDTMTTRSIAAGSTKISVSNGSGVAGDPTLDVVEANLTHDNIGGTLGISKGGSGQTTANAALNAFLPSQSSQGGKFLQTDGSNTSWQTASGGGGMTTTYITGTTTASSGVKYLANTTGGAFTVTLPTGASGAMVAVVDDSETWDTNNLTIAPASGQKIDNLATNETLVCDVRRGWVLLSWDNTNSKWVIETLSSSASLIPTLKSANFTAESGRQYLTDTSGGAFVATLPSGSGQAVIEFVDAARTWNGFNLTITPASGQIIDGLAANDSLVCDIIGGWAELSWNGTKWVLKSIASTTVAEASSTVAGIVNTGSQTFGGRKSAGNSKVKVHRNGSTQSIGDVTAVKIQFTTEVFDTNNEFDNTTNYRFTCARAGYYLVSAQAEFVHNLTAPDINATIQLRLTKNGSDHLYDVVSPINVSGTFRYPRPVMKICDVLSLIVGDYIEIVAYQQTGGTQTLQADAASTPRLTIVELL